MADRPIDLEEARRQQKGRQPKMPAEPLTLLWFDQIEPVLDSQDFVQGLLTEQSAAVVYGESNSGKTFWTTDLALHVAAGMEWNGRRVDQGGVIYCALEGGRGFRNRVAAWGRAHPQPPGRLPFAAIQSCLNLLHPEADTPRLIEAIKAAAAAIGGPVKLVVIDTLSRALSGGNENGSEDMGSLVRNMDLIREATGACVLFIHHSGKDQARGARGHSLLRAAVDTEIEVTATADCRAATVVKQREMQTGDVFPFTLKAEELGQNERGEPVTSCTLETAGLIAGTIQDRKRTKAASRLSPTAATALRALENALSRAGKLLPETSGYPTRTVAVPAAEWRAEFYELKGGSAEANRKAFNRAEDELLAATAITQRNGLVWVVSRNPDSGT